MLMNRLHKPASHVDIQISAKGQKSKNLKGKKREHGVEAVFSFSETGVHQIYLQI